MIKAIELYLVTDGQGLAAVDFYKDVFDAEVVACTTFGQAMPDVPAEQKDLLLNASLNINGIRFQISDNSPQADYRQGNHVTACLQLDDATEAQAIFQKLSQTAQKIELPFGETPWSPGYGIVVDQFGVTWQVNTDVPGFVSETVSF